MSPEEKAEDLICSFMNQISSAVGEKDEKHKMAAIKCARRYAQEMIHRTIFWQKVKNRLDEIKEYA